MGNPFESGPQQPDSVEKNLTERKLYSLESGESIELLAREFTNPHPKKDLFPDASVESERNDRGIIFVSGWEADADIKAVERLNQAFADNADARVYSVSTRIDKTPAGLETMVKEAEAIGRFIKEKGLKELVLSGLSQGGDKAVNLCALLEQDPNISVKGVSLLDSVGLYEQTPLQLAGGFIKDSIVGTPVAVTKHAMTKGDFKPMIQALRTGGSVVWGIFREIAASGTKYLQRFENEVKAMAALNPRLESIKAKVVLVCGKNDPISKPKGLIPEGEEEKIITAWEQSENDPSRKPYIDPREEILKRDVFKRSSHVRLVIPEKLSNHALPLMRPESVGRVSLYLLKRAYRSRSAEPETSL